jgi:hypothetical protein
VLSGLRARERARPEAVQLEALLVYFIELDPSAESFADVLERYAADPREPIAEAARLLQVAWQRGRHGSTTSEEHP